MDQLEFRNVLLKTAFATMACDGHIDQREIDELAAINENTKYFDGVEFQRILDGLLADFSQGSGSAIKHILGEVLACDMSPLQKLLVLEVSIRIINSDEKHDENEVRFIHLLRSKLNVSNEVIFDRFGALPILNISEQKEVDPLPNSAKKHEFPELVETTGYDFSKLSL